MRVEERIVFIFSKEEKERLNLMFNKMHDICLNRENCKNCPLVVSNGNCIDSSTLETLLLLLDNENVVIEGD